MLGRYFPSRCCCAIEEQPTTPCPCQDGTLELPAAHDIVVSGVVPSDPTYNTMNGSYTPNRKFSLLTCGLQYSIGDGLIGGLTTGRFWKMTFTRLNVVDGLSYPSGIKALIQLSQTAIPSLVAESSAYFYKVLSSNANGSINCSDSITGFTLLGQSPADGPAFDASAATVTYT